MRDVVKTSERYLHKPENKIKATFQKRKYVNMLRICRVYTIF